MRFSVLIAIRICALICLVLSSARIVGQPSDYRSAIGGTLSDRTGALITGAAITIRAIDRDLSWNVVTDSSGEYKLDNLPAGRYMLAVHQGGFSELMQSVTLAAGESANIPFVLSIGSVVQQVEVTGVPANDGLTLQEIREGAARDLGEATSEIAGVTKVRKAAIANDVAIRGLFHDNLAMTFDGERMYGACAGQMDPAAYHVDLSEVDHVDIVKGPFDVSTQGALGGFVKVITKTPNTRGLSLDSNVSIGSYGYYNPSGTIQIGNEAVHVLSGYSYRTSEFYRDGNGIKVSNLGSYRNNAQDLQAFRTQTVWTKSAFQFTDNQRGEISYKRQQSGDVLYPYMTMDAVFDNSDLFSLRYDNVQFNPWMKAVHSVMYFDKVNHRMDNHLRASAGALPNSMSTQVVSFTNGLRFDTDLTKGIRAGYEYYRRYWNSDGYMISSMMGKNITMFSQTLPGVTENVHGTYVAYRVGIGDRILLTAGGRYDHSNSNASNADPAIYDAYHGTRATKSDDAGISGNVKLSFDFGDTISVFTGVGSNIRFPDPQERFFRSDSSMGNGWVGNPILAHPRNTEADLGITQRGRRFTVSSLGFFSKLDNFVSLYAADRLRSVPGVASAKAQSYANVQAYLWGAELTSTAQINDSVTAIGTFSITRGTKVPQPEIKILSRNLFQVPPMRSQIDVRYEKHAVLVGATAVLAGRQNRIDSDVNEKSTAGFSIFNFKLGYRANQFRIEGGMNNILARQYTEYLSFARNPYASGIRLPEPGRNFFMNLSYAFDRKGLKFRE